MRGFFHQSKDNNFSSRAIFQRLILSFLAILFALLIGEALARSIYYSKNGEAYSALMDATKRASINWRTNGTGLSGKDLNRKAWETSYTERGLDIPEKGPREGYWGYKIGKKKKHTLLGWIEPEMDQGAYFKIDQNGLQQIGNDSAALHLLIIGASVAWGSYASTQHNTYFSKLYHQLSQQGKDLKISVLAAGAWISSQEVMALLHKGLDLDPDAVLFLDGMNDLTNIDEPDIDRAKQFIDNMKLAKVICASKDIQLFYGLQPSIAEKKIKSNLEKRIIQISMKEAYVKESYRNIRIALRALEDDQTQFLDCSNVFSDESTTTFADIWHFSDPGHQLLGDHIATYLLDFGDF